MRRDTIDLLLVFLAMAWVAGCAGSKDRAEQRHRSVTREPFGTTQDGVRVERYTLTSPSGSKASVLTYGCILTELWVPDRSGVLGDVILGFDQLAAYEGTCPIGGLDPQLLPAAVYRLDQRVWSARPMRSKRPGVELWTEVPDLLTMRVSICWEDDNVLRIDTEGTSTCHADVKLAEHPWFNLATPEQAGVLDHHVMVPGAHYVESSHAGVANRPVLPVEGTLFDLRTELKVGSALSKLPRGLDVSYILIPAPQEMNTAGLLRDPSSGRQLILQTSQPAVRLRSMSNPSSPVIGKNGTRYGRFHALRLGTQHDPVFTNPAVVSSVRLSRNDRYHHSVRFRFETTPGELESPGSGL